MHTPHLHWSFLLPTLLPSQNIPSYIYRHFLFYIFLLLTVTLLPASLLLPSSSPFSLSPSSSRAPPDRTPAPTASASPTQLPPTAAISPPTPVLLSVPETRLPGAPPAPCPVSNNSGSSSSSSEEEFYSPKDSAGEQGSNREPAYVELKEGLHDAEEWISELRFVPILHCGVCLVPRRLPQAAEDPPTIKSRISRAESAVVGVTELRSSPPPPRTPLLLPLTKAKAAFPFLTSFTAEGGCPHQGGNSGASEPKIDLSIAEIHLPPPPPPPPPQPR